MRLQPQSVRWFPFATLLLLGACSQVPPPSQVADAPSPIATQTETAPSPVPSATAPTRPLPPATDTTTQAMSSIAPASQSVSKAVGTLKPSIAANPNARSVVRPPTFQATPRMEGFSPDGNYFIYLESSRDTGAGVPQSALQLVNVASNRCVENGCIQTRYGEKEAAIQTADAEAALLQQTWKVRQDLKLTPPVAGTELPILSRSRAADGSETVTVQLTDASQPLHLHLHQKSEPDKAAMQLEVNYNGQQRSIDSLDNFRPNVLGYTIRQVTLAPDGKRVAVLITATKPTFEGTLGTTIVQGFVL